MFNHVAILYNCLVFKQLQNEVQMNLIFYFAENQQNVQNCDVTELFLPL